MVSRDGLLLGEIVTVGFSEGWLITEGSNDGSRLGPIVGLCVIVGWLEGCKLGDEVGNEVEG